MQVYTVDKGFGDFESKIDETTGYLELSGILARTGVQDYYGLELGEDAIKEFNLNPMEVYGVYRPKEEVLSPLSLDTYINKSVTDDHPKEFVNSKNEITLGKGSVSQITTFNKDGIDYVKSRLTIKNEDTIAKALSGKKELSPGYTQKLVREDGEFLGKKYMFKQTDIKINHVALVDKGRCGGECKIVTDSNDIIYTNTKNKKGTSMPKIVIDSVEHELNDCVAKHIGSLNARIKSLDEEMKEKDEEMEKQDEEMEKLKAEKDMTEEELAKEKESKMAEDSALSLMIDAKVDLMLIAKSNGIDLKSSDSVADMKKAIVTSKSKINLDGKSEAYIDAAFDMLKLNEIKDSQVKVADGFESKANKTTDATVSANIFAKRQSAFRKVGK